MSEPLSPSEERELLRMFKRYLKVATAMSVGKPFSVAEHMQAHNVVFGDPHVVSFINDLLSQQNFDDES